MQYMSKAGFDPSAAVGLQQTFVRLANKRQSNWLEGLFSSHPPSQERVDANIETAKSLPIDGLLGRDFYQEQVAVLREQAPGYEAIDEGYKALSKRRYQQAIQFAETAIQIIPRESLGYALRAAAKAEMGWIYEAVQDYDQAIQRNDRYFRHYFERGLLRIGYFPLVSLGDFSPIFLLIRISAFSALAALFSLAQVLNPQAPQSQLVSDLVKMAPIVSIPS